MNDTKKKVTVFLVTLGSVLMIACISLYAFSKWMKEGRISSTDLIVTIGVVLCSTAVFVVSLVCCLRGHNETPSDKQVFRRSTYIPVNKMFGSNCGICIEAKDSKVTKVVKLTCGHSFHRDCVLKSLETQPKCPICRQTPSKYSSIERVLYVVYGRVNKTVKLVQNKREQQHEEGKGVPV